MRCAICGRPLSNPQSLRRGIGPKCYAKYFKSGEFKKVDRIEELRRKAAYATISPCPWEKERGRGSLVKAREGFGSENPRG